MAKKGLRPSLTRKSDGDYLEDQQAVDKWTQELYYKAVRGESEAAVRILEDASQSVETRAKVLAYCEALADAGLKTARKSLTIALQQSPLFHEKEQAVLPLLRMTALQPGETASTICDRVQQTMPSQVFVTGGGIFNEVVDDYQKIRDALGSQYNIQLLSTTSRALIRHSLIVLRREIQADPGRRNLVIGIYPGVSWFYFLQFHTCVYDLFRPWPHQEFNAAVFLVGTLSYAYLIEAASLIAGGDCAPGTFENLVSTGNARLTNRVHDQIQAAASPEEQSELLLQYSKAILKEYTDIEDQRISFTGDPDALKALKHTAYAELYISRGMYEEAIIELKPASKLETNLFVLENININIALCYAHLGKFGKAKSILRNSPGFSHPPFAEALQLVERIRHLPKIA